MEHLEEASRKHMTLAELLEETTYRPSRQQPPCCLPTISPEMRLKWGLSLLGQEKAFEYLQWLRRRLEDNQ